MIDKLNFYASYPSVMKSSKLTIEQGRKNCSTGVVFGAGILWIEGLKTINGMKAYYNETGIQIKISPGNKNRPPMLYVSLNPSILINGHNFFTLTYNEFKKSLQLAQNILIKVGIVTKIDECKLGRIDICRNIDLDYKFDTYISALKTISPKYMLRNPTVLNDGYFRRGNGSLQYCCYDKLAEFASKNNIFDAANLGITSQNIGRFEIRYTRHITIKKVFGVETVGELNNKTTFSSLIDIYKEYLKSNFFRFSNIKDAVVVINTDKELFSRIMDKHPRIGIYLFLAHRQLMGDEPFTLDSITSLMESMGISQSTIADVKKHIMSVVKMGCEVKQEPLNSSELLREMYTKLIKA